MGDASPVIEHDDETDMILEETEVEPIFMAHEDSECSSSTVAKRTRPVYFCIHCGSVVFTLDYYHVPIYWRLLFGQLIVSSSKVKSV